MRLNKVEKVVIFACAAMLGYLVINNNNTVPELRSEVRIIERIIEREYVEPFSEESFIDYLREINIRYPEVVYAQAVLETGYFKSKVFKKNNNLFGMKLASRRPRMSFKLQHNHAEYRNWKESVIDYAFYQSHFLSDIKTKAEYIETVGRIYAEDPRYRKKIQIIIDQKFGSKK